jgi:hypothetical protein
MPTVRTVTVKPSGGDYTSLSAAEAGEQGDLVSLDRQLDIECYAMEDTAQVAWGGWTTDATRYIRIFTPASERHDGKWSTSAYRLRVTSGWGGFFTMFDVSDAHFMRIDGLQFGAEPNEGGSRGAVYAGDQCRVSNCVIYNAPAAGLTGSSGLSIAFTGGKAYAWNNIVYLQGTSSGGSGLNASTGNFNHKAVIYNNTAYGFDKNFTYASGSGATAKNNLAQAGVTADYDPRDAGGSSNNLSEDATSPDAALRNKVVSFVNEAGFDFHLSGSDTAAKDAGADLSADADLAFSTDIDGDTRSGSWDIGADEAAAAAGVIYTQLERGTRGMARGLALARV